MQESPSLSYLLAMAWLAEKEVDEETAERILPIVENLVDFLRELGTLRGEIKLGFKNLDEVKNEI